jgi:hypothetical protein
MIDYTSQVGNKTQLDPRQFNWVRVFNGGLGGVTGDLSTPGVKTLSFAIMPRGLVADDYVYISGGIGTPEVAQISLVSGTPGSAGTISITTSNAHTGNWQVGSATAGIQEALRSTTKPSLFIPVGTYTLFATVKLPYQAEIAGAGTGTLIQIGTPGMTMFYATDDPFLARVTIHDVSIVGTGNVNEKGLHFYKTHRANVYNIYADLLFYTIWWDQVNESIFRDSYLYNNSAMYIGSSVDGPTGYSFLPNVSNITHFTALPAENFHIPALLTLERTVTANITDLKTRGLWSKAICVLMRNNCEGTMINGLVAVQGSIGIAVKKNTVGTTTAAPFFTTITNCQIDGSAVHAIELEDTNHVLISKNSITGQSFYGMLYGIYMHTNTRNVTITDNVLQNMHGTAIVANDGVGNFQIRGNYFANPTTHAGILIGDGNAGNYVSVTGNFFSVLDTASPKIAYNDSNARQPWVLIHDNLGVDDIQVTTTAASSVQLNSPVHIVGGSATISNILQTGYFRGRSVTFIPTGDATWSMDTSGNIGRATTAVPGRALILTYVLAEQKWYPSY